MDVSLVNLVGVDPSKSRGKESRGSTYFWMSVCMLVFNILSCCLLLINTVFFLLFISTVNSIVMNPEISSLTVKIEKLINTICSQVGC